MNTQEQWMPIKGFEGKYEISSYGRVKSVRRIKHIPNGEMRMSNERILKPWELKSGYLLTYLYKDSERFSPRIHRLVAEAFIPNPTHLPQVNHIDGDKTNNNISNLEWVSRSENCKHSARVLHRGGGIKVGQYSRNGVLLRKWANASEASEALGINRANIRLCANNIRKTAGNFIWRNI